MGLDIDIRPEMERRTVEIDGGIVRKVEAFAEFVRQNDSEVGFDHVVEYLVQRVLSESEAQDLLAYRKWRRESDEDSGCSDVPEGDDESTASTKTCEEETWAGETGEMTRPVNEDEDSRPDTTPEERAIRRSERSNEHG